MVTIKNKIMEDLKEYKLKNIVAEPANNGFKRTKISNSDDAYNIIKEFYKDDMTIFESFFILLLDRANNTIGYAKISQGGVAGTVVDSKIVFKYAIDTLASGIILAHNHPGGTLVPSEADKRLTNKMVKQGKLMDIPILDHLILTEDKFFSFADNGLI